jgi:predicted peroxiredoxin
MRAGMRGLGIIIGGTDLSRLGTALTLAASQAALGARVRLLFDGDAVRLATTRDELFESCLELGVAVTLCQSGLASAGLEAATLDPRFEYGGIVGWLAALGEDRLILA